MPYYDSNTHNKIFSLSEVCASIKRTINNRYGSDFWVEGEMLRLNHYPYNGNAFPDLIEKKDGTVVAQMRAVIWASDFRRIANKFKLYHSIELKDGINILFRASIIYDTFYGLSLRIIDIDPAFTLGQMEKERQECIDRLKKENIFGLNKQKVLSLLPKRLAIISVESSKGYNDFVNIINSYSNRYSVFYYLFPSLLQGDGAVSSIIRVLEKIRLVYDFFDAVVIIRGGGGDLGLSAYNNYELCKAVLYCPLPVLTGIGHSTNETVCEMIAFHNGITPTDLADFIMQRFVKTDELLHQTIDMLKLKCANRIENEKEKLAMLDKYIDLLNPTNTLNKGYSVTLKDGKTIRQANQLKKGDRIVTRFSQGEITSIVE